MKYYLGEKIIGEERGGVLFKLVKASIHRMRLFDCYGISQGVIEKTKGRCKEILIEDVESGENWAVNMQVFLQNAITGEFGGYEKQSFLPRRFWMIRDKKGKVISEGEKVEEVAQAKLL